MQCESYPNCLGYQRIAQVCQHDMRDPFKFRLHNAGT